MWSLWWERLQADISLEDPALAEALTGPATQGRTASGKTNVSASGKEDGEPVPWRGFLRNRAVQALGYVHFCNNWCARMLARAGRAARAVRQNARYSLLAAVAQDAASVCPRESSVTARVGAVPSPRPGHCCQVPTPF